MRILTLWWSLPCLAACAAPGGGSPATAAPAARLVLMAAQGTIGVCPSGSAVCEISVTGVPGAGGGCAASVPFQAMEVEKKGHPNDPSTTIRWVVANPHEYAFVTSGANSGVVISRNRVVGGTGGAFVECGFEPGSSDKAYACKSTHGKTLGRKDPGAPGFDTYLVRRADGKACDANDPPIVNKD